MRRALNERRILRENATLRRNLQSAYARRPLLGDGLTTAPQKRGVKNAQVKR